MGTIIISNGRKYLAHYDIDGILCKPDIDDKKKLL